ncbi:MAG: acetyl-CoA acetyltransferase, partial [Pseudomonadota bacterium]
MPKGAVPVLVGVGQITDHWDGTAGPDGAPSPKSLCVSASEMALNDAGIAASEIDTITVVRIFEDSVPGDRHPHGHNTNLPGTIARDIGASPERAIYAAVGGQSPQQLANEMAARIHAGEIECALVTGSEANKASKAARKHGVDISWADSNDLAIEDRGMGEMLLSRPEIKHGIIAPAYFYALFENAMAARDGQTRTQRRQEMSTLFAKFAAVAAKHPDAQFDTKSFDADFLATPSKANYPFADPFLKWHIAQDAVNQGAAFIIMSEDKADALGIAPNKRVYLHGGGEASDDFI